MRGLWKRFCKEQPDIKTTRMNLRGKKNPISFSCFRDIFTRYLSNELSFRMPRTDTCQKCEELIKKTNDCERTLQNQSISPNSRLATQRTLRMHSDELNCHLDEAELRFAMIDYDMKVRCVEKRANDV